MEALYRMSPGAGFSVLSQKYLTTRPPFHPVPRRCLRSPTLRRSPALWRLASRATRRPNSGNLFLGQNTGTSRPPAHVLFLCFLVFLALMPARGAADEGRIRLSGYAKSFVMLEQRASVPDIRKPEPRRIWLNRVRVKLFWRPAPVLSGEFAYDLSARAAGAPSAGAPWLPASALLDYRVKDLGARLYPRADGTDRSFTVTQNLDRALLTVSLPRADVYVGRQVVAFGSARAVNPTDVITPFSPEVLDREERVGVDAVRLRVPVGTMGELDAGVVPGWDVSKQSGAGFVRGRFMAHGADVHVMAMGFREHLLLGLDVAGSLGDAGAWLEAAWTRKPDGRSFLRISTGLDHRISNGVYGTLEYHLNGAGVSRSRDYRTLLEDRTYAAGGVFLLGRHYVAPGLAWQLTPLWSVRMPVLWNLSDRSAFLSPAIEYGCFQNGTVSGGVLLGLGRGSGAPPSRASNGVQSEFGQFPTLGFVSVNYYF